VTFTFGREFGTLRAGTRLLFRTAGNEHSRAFLPLGPEGAEVLASDGRGRPALLLRRAGAGSLVLCTYPIEHMAAVTPRVNPEDTGAIYAALSAHADVRRLVSADDPRIAADVLVRSDGRRFAWLVSQAKEPVTVQPQLAPGLRLAPLDGAGVDGVVTLPPFGVGVLQVQEVTRG